MVNLEYQAARDPQKVRRFLMRYQDRILYGSDVSYDPDDTDPAEVAGVHAGWLADRRCLATADRMHSDDFDGAFHGLHVPRTVVDKSYRRNAEELFGGAWDTTRRQ
jgi:hypothetical protein